MSLRTNQLKFMTSEKFMTLEEILLKAMQNEWQFCLGLHLHSGWRPLFIPGCGCRCRSINDWACSYTHLSYHWFLLMKLLVPSQLRLKATNHKSGRQHFQRSYILASCLGTDGRVGSFISLKPPLLNHATSFANQARHQIMSMMVQRLCFQNQLLGLAKVMWGGGIISTLSLKLAPMPTL